MTPAKISDERLKHGTRTCFHGLPLMLGSILLVELVNRALRFRNCRLATSIGPLIARTDFLSLTLTQLPIGTWTSVHPMQVGNGIAKKTR